MEKHNPNRETAKGLAKLLYVTGQNLKDVIKSDARGFYYVNVDLMIEHADAMGRENGGVNFTSYELESLKGKYRSIAVPTLTHPFNNGAHILTNNDLIGYAQTEIGLIIPSEMSKTLSQLTETDIPSNMLSALKTKPYTPQFPLKILV
ncbi:MAG: hypothetical protein AABW51_03265 [Nanoarchaeota archaeon]